MTDDQSTSEGCQWVQESNGDIPPGAVIGGMDVDGSDIYVGRAWESDDLIPAKVCPHHGAAFVSYAGVEYRKDTYEVLVSDRISWKPGDEGYVPPEAVKVGHTVDGHPLYTGRVLYQGTLTLGKIQPQHGGLYIPWDGGEVKFDEYDVMVLQD